MSSNTLLMRTLPSFKTSSVLKTAQLFCIAFCILNRNSDVGVEPLAFLNLSSLSIEFCPASLGNSTSKTSINEMFKKFSNGSPYSEKTLFIKGRELKIERQALGCARFEFEDLCGKPLGAEDFLSIAKEFDIIFIENIPKMSPEKRNEAKRFISLIG